MPLKIQNTIFQGLNRRFEVEEPTRIETLNDNIQLVQSLEDLSLFRGYIYKTVGNIPNLDPLIKLAANELEPGNEMGFLFKDIISIRVNRIALNILNLSAAVENITLRLRFTQQLASGLDIVENVDTTNVNIPAGANLDVFRNVERTFFSGSRSTVTTRHPKMLFYTVQNQTSPIDLSYRMSFEVEVKTRFDTINKIPRDVNEFFGLQ